MKRPSRQAKTKRLRSSLFIAISIFLSGAILYQPDISVAEFSGVALSQTTSWLDLGKTHLKQGDYQQALESFNKFLNLSSAQDLHLLDCYMNLWVLYWNLGRYEEAEDFMKRGSELSLALGRKEERRVCEAALEVHRLFSEGLAWREKGNLSQADNCFETAVLGAAAIKSPALELKILRIWSANYLGEPKNSAYLDLNKRAFDMALALNNRLEILRTSLNMGANYVRLGDYSHSLSWYTKAVEYARALKDDKLLAGCLGNIAYVYASLGDYKRGFEYASEAIEVSRQGEMPRPLATQFINLGLAFLSRSRLTRTADFYPRALECFEAGYQLAVKAGQEGPAQAALVNMGLVYADLHDFDKAVSILSPALEKARKKSDSFLSGYILNTLGTVALDQLNVLKADGYFREAFIAAEKCGDVRLMIDAKYGLGRCQEENGAYDQAIFLYNDTIKAIDERGSRIIDDINRSEYIYRWREVNQRLIDLDYKLFNRTRSSVFEADIYANVERMRARSFLEFLERQSRLETAETTDETKAREDRIKSERLGYLRELSQNSLNQGKREELEREIRQREDMLNTIFLDRYLHEGVRGISKDPVAVGVLQREALQPNTALIEYFLGDNRSFLFFMTSSTFRVFVLPPAQQIHDSVIAYINFLRDRSLEPATGVAAAERLYQELFLPADDILPKTIRRLIIVPDGILFSLPFETLMRASADPGASEYLVNRFTISYAPSASALFYLQKKLKRTAYRKDFLALGNPAHQDVSPSTEKGLPSANRLLGDIYKRNGLKLDPIPFSKNEVNRISRKFDSKKKDIYLGEEATEKTLKALALDDYRIVHIACHAISDENYPLRSALILAVAADDEDDGFLQVQEMYGMRLSADLVVLSACQTAEGKNIRNEGILGLPRIFFYMGARSVISTLWRIDDRATAEFMDDFYEALAQGLGKAEALRLAKEKMMKSRKYAHPFYWSAFILTGES